MNEIIMPEQAKIPPKPLARPDNSDNPITTIAKMVASGASKEIIEQMMKLVEWDDARRAKAEFNTAFSSAKQKFKKARRSGYNTHLKSHYSLLEDLDEATREALSEFGLSWRHVVATLPGDITLVKCVVAHKGGHHEQAVLEAPSYSMTNNAVNKLQSVGIVVTYLQRKTLGPLLGIVSDSELDNDGEGGGELITPEQALTLHAKLTDNGLDMDKFNDWLRTDLKCTKLDELPVQALKTVERAIDASIKARKKKEQK
jgi:hypothetical protein